VSRRVSLLLALAAIAVYLPALNLGFVFDDREYILTNAALRLPFAAAVRWSFTSFYSANWHPLTWLSHFADVALFGVSPRGHHVVNVLVHAANTVLLFLLLRGATGAVWRSAFVAALFALHPLHVESVAWVAARKDLLSAFFFLLTLLAYVRFARRPSPARYGLALGLFALGLLAKPMLVTVPFVLLLLDWWPLGRLPGRSGQPARPGAGAPALLLEKVPFLALAAASCAVTVLAQQSWGAIKAVPLDARLANVPVAYAGYLLKAVWPAGLAFYYPLPAAGTPLWQAALSLAALLGLSAGVVRCSRTRRWLAVGWLWYLGMLVPVVGFVQVGLQSMADRYTYLPLIGVFIGVAWLGAELAERFSGAARPIVAAACLSLAALGAATWVQAGYWRSDVTLSAHALEVTTGNWMAHNNLAAGLHLQGRDDEALAQQQQALSINPLLAEAWYGRGVIMSARRRTSEALASFENALSLKPEFVEARLGTAIALTALGRFEAALGAYREVLARNPQHEVARINLANLLDDLGRSDEAIAQYRETLRINPRNELAHYNLGIGLKKRGRWPEARAAFEAALRLRPDYPEARGALGQLP
jgi:Flp pilus assembly protein TadD